MSRTITDEDLPRVIHIRSDRAERLDSIGHVMLADSSATGGALSSHRVDLAPGADGSVPHRHNTFTETFYVLDGVLDVLAGQEVLTARAGDLVVVPPGVVHAYAAHHGSGAAAPVVATPGVVERFEYFHHLVRRRAGLEPAEVLLASQDRFDTHFTDRAAWQKARGKSIASAYQSRPANARRNVTLRVGSGGDDPW